MRTISHTRVTRQTVCFNSSIPIQNTNRFSPSKDTIRHTYSMLATMIRGAISTPQKGAYLMVNGPQARTYEYIMYGTNSHANMPSRVQSSGDSQFFDYAHKPISARIVQHLFVGGLLCGLSSPACCSTGCYCCFHR